MLGNRKNAKAEVPVNGHEHQPAGEGAAISLNWIESELKKLQVCAKDEVISQVNVSEKELIFYFKKVTN